VGGENPEEWGAVGVPTTQRGRRTDEMLQALPDLLAGRPRQMRTEAVQIPALAPTTAMPPVIVGGRSEAALARTVASGDMWLGAFADRDRMVRASDRMAELASEAGRDTVPATGLTFITSVGPDAAAATEQARRYVESNYQARWEQVRRYAIVGELDDVVAQLAEFWQVGLRHIVLQPAGVDPLRECEQLAAVRESLLAAVGPSPGE
jgi:alkanesulfonate monooxygenase SsuD/methylene tetrahydromethanopterin reductase-like flavin-dependent oxidoreductase (luciferase family)